MQKTRTRNTPVTKNESTSLFKGVNVRMKNIYQLFKKYNTYNIFIINQLDWLQQKIATKNILFIGCSQQKSHNTIELDF